MRKLKMPDNSQPISCNLTGSNVPEEMFFSDNVSSIIGIDVAVDGLSIEKRPKILSTIGRFTLILAVGTGGIVSGASLEKKAQYLTSNQIVISEQPLKTRSHAEEVKTTPEMVAALQQCLSFNITDIAKILGVQRPAIYSWLGNESVEPHPRNKAKLKEVSKIAFSWNKLSNEPVGKYNKEPLIQEKSLLEALASDSIDTEAVQDALTVIKQTKNKQKKYKRKSVATLAREAGFSELSEDMKKKAFDLIYRQS